MGADDATENGEKLLGEHPPQHGQDDIVAFLSTPQAFGLEGEAVVHLQTHISHIFLCGTRALKLKKAVRFPYLDFSTLDARESACQQEVMLNRRTASAMYRGVLSVNRAQDGTLEIAGAGEVVDWLVNMTRFDDATLFDRLVELPVDAGGLDRHMMETLGDTIASFHAHAEQRTDGGGYGGLGMIIDSNVKTFNLVGPGVLDMGEVKAFSTDCWTVLDGLAELLEKRRQCGCVRFCHGDLHLRNIYLQDGAPVLFDAIEFNEQLNKIDVLYDLAFVLMDLDMRDKRDLACVLMNRYLDITGGGWGLAAMPLFMALRAAIRSHVAASAADGELDAGRRAGCETQARHYFSHARDYLRPAPPRLIAVGGLSGSGKSRMGREIAPLIGRAPGARIVRSDTIRKRIAGVHPLDRLGADGYTPEMTEQTFNVLFEEAELLLSTGHSVVADAVFAKPEQRQAIEDVARRAGVPFDGVWLEAPRDILEQRVTARVANPSDADASVVRRQFAYDLGEINWSRVDSSGPRDATIAIGRRILDL